MHNDICLQINSANIILKNIKYALYHRIFVTYTCFCIFCAFLTTVISITFSWLIINFMIFVPVNIFQHLKAKIHGHFQGAVEGFMTYLLMGKDPGPQPFISADWYMGLLWGCCCIMGFWGPPIRPDIIVLGGLLPLPTNEGSPCWPIPGITIQTHL